MFLTIIEVWCGVGALAGYVGECRNAYTGRVGALYGDGGILGLTWAMVWGAICGPLSILFTAIDW